MGVVKLRLDTFDHSSEATDPAPPLTTPPPARYYG